LHYIYNLARLYRSENKSGQAELLLREAVNGYEKAGPDIWRRYNCQSMLGASLADQKKYAEAEALLLSGYQGMLQREATIPASERIELERAGEWIVQLYQDWGKPDKAAEWREKLRTVERSSSR
jgi:hypothetical protein